MTHKPYSVRRFNVPKKHSEVFARLSCGYREAAKSAVRVYKVSKDHCKACRYLQDSCTVFIRSPLSRGIITSCPDLDICVLRKVRIKTILELSCAKQRNSHFAGRSKISYLARSNFGTVPAQSRNQDKKRIYCFPCAK